MSTRFKFLNVLGCIAIAAATAAFAQTASAESIRLVKPSQAAALHNSSVVMTVYYLDQADALDVVAQFVDQTSARPAGRLQIGLVDGEHIAFTVPGRPDVSFQFTRSGSVVEVHGNPSEPGPLAATQ
jgi:hypothetical protein